MLQGAGIALVLITIFLAGVDDPNPDWPKFWMVKPLLVVPIAGAMGGVFYYFMDFMRNQGLWIKILANVISLFAYLVAIWLGSVLGLDGTLWN
jgi:hypothetical protein